MKTNFNKSLKKNKPIHIHSTVYPAGGYVAMPENKPSGFGEKKRNKKIKNLWQEFVTLVDIIKPIKYYIASICRKREKEVSL